MLQLIKTKYYYILLVSLLNKLRLNEFVNSE